MNIITKGPMGTPEKQQLLNYKKRMLNLNRKTSQQHT